MGCGQSVDTSHIQSNNSKLAIWGDYFNQDTRALMAICEMAEISPFFGIVDTFKKEHLEPHYLAVNPTSSIPMITDGQWKIFGESSMVYNFLIQNYPKIKARFYCEEQEAKVNDLFRHFMKSMRKITVPLIRSITNKKVYNNPKELSREKTEQCLRDFNEIMVRYDG